MSYRTEELILVDDGTKYFRRVAPNSWWGLLEKYLQDNYIKCTIQNNGCGGVFSYQINKYLDTLITSDDTLVFVLMGLNDRKLANGMEELKANCECVVDKLVCNVDVIDSKHWNESYLSDFFDVTIFSCDVGMLKPDIEIYKLAMDTLEIMPEESIFVGDGGSNELYGAKKAGMKTIFTEYLVHKSKIENETIRKYADYHIDYFDELLGYLDLKIIQ